MTSSTIFQRNKSKPKTDEHYTPDYILSPVRQTVGHFDLDPASCPEANRRVMAKNIYTKEDNGLMQDWYGTVWCNPPYSREAGGVGKWVDKAIQQHVLGHSESIVMLLNSNTSSSWFHKLAAHHSTICFVNKRIKFISEDGQVMDKPVAGNILILTSCDDRLHSLFSDQLSEIGTVMRKI